MSDSVTLSFRTVLLTILIPIFVPSSALLVALWQVSGWVTHVETRLAEVEKVTDRDRAQETRIGYLEQRLNWLDEEAKRNRSEGIQINRDIRDNLERLKDAVTRLESTYPLRRRSSFDGLYAPAATTDCLYSPLCSDVDTDAPRADQSEHSGDQTGHKQDKTEAR